VSANTVSANTASANAVSPNTGATKAFVIVGAGLAGAKAAEALRGRGFDGKISLIGAEEHLPYERPPLSKDYLSGKADRSSVFVHDHAWYQQQEIDLRLGRPATAIDRAARQVRLADGSHLPYDKLLIATGSSPRQLPGASGVHYLRTIDDSDRLKELLAGGSHLAVIGGGWIGLEVAAAARQAGLQVTVLETLELPLLRVLGREMAQVFADLHRSNGVTLRLGVQIEEILKRGGSATNAQATGVRLTDGTRIDADVILAGIGAAPRTELASDAGLEVSDGVVTTAALQTSDPDIFAAGDIASAFHPLFGAHVRVEHWANALKQPAVAAAAMLGQDASYEDLPYFYTDQYDLGMEYVGHVGHGYDQVVVRGDLEARQFIAFWLSGGRVKAGMNVNVWDVTDSVKALIRSGHPVDAQALADPGTALDDLAKG
jgi:3-phenylpropionate/trans-cinnamate dioxygenase ferredoxin reductase subunit